MRVRDLKSPSKDELVSYQRRGCFDEHLVTFYSLAYGKPYIYRDTYLLYSDPLTKTLSVFLFELGKKEHMLQCVKTALSAFKPNRFLVDSPEELPLDIGNYHRERIFVDKDYQINLREFDENLRGKAYEKLRYRVNNAKKRGYVLKVDKKMTAAHSFVIASHMTKEIYNVWDYQLYLAINEYVTRFSSPRFFNVFLNGELVGFDLVDFTDTVMIVPLGFILASHPSLSDFLMFEEVIYAKKQGLDWLDVGWSCDPGLEEFKKKWTAIPRFTVYVQEYFRKDVSSTRITAQDIQ